MAVFAGPKTPNNNNRLVFLDASNPKSYSIIEKSLTDLKTGTQINANNIQYDTGYLNSEYDILNTNISTTPSESLTVIVQVRNSAITEGAIYNISSGIHRIYSPQLSVNYEYVVYDVGSTGSANNTLQYYILDTTNYENLVYDAGATGSSNNTLQYYISDTINYDNVVYDISSTGSANNTLIYEISTNPIYDEFSNDIISYEVFSYIDNREQIIELGFKSKSVYLRLKKNDCDVNLTHSYEPLSNDIFSVAILHSSNTYSVSLYQNSSLLETASAQSYDNTIPDGTVTLFGNHDHANYSNAPMRIFSVFDKTLTPAEIAEFSNAIHPN